MKRTFTRILIVLSFATGATTLSSCTGHRDDQPVAEEPHVTTPSPLVQRDPPTPRHSSQLQPLRELMKRISKDTQENWPERMPRAGEEHRAEELVIEADKAARLADELAAAAEGIPVTVRHVEMTKTDRADFDAEARTLRITAKELGNAARARQPEQMQDRLDAVSTTCINCHRRFRDYIGDLDIQRVRTDEPGDAAALARVWSR